MPTSVVIVDLTDVDGDGYASTQVSGGTDCDDTFFHATNPDGDASPLSDPLAIQQLARRIRIEVVEPALPLKWAKLRNDDDKIECPLHQGKFDVRDGRPLCEPVAQALRSYPIKVEAGRVLLDADELRHALARRCLLTFAPESSTAVSARPQRAAMWCPPPTTTTLSRP